MISFKQSVSKRKRRERNSIFSMDEPCHFWRLSLAQMATAEARHGGLSAKRCLKL